MNSNEILRRRITAWSFSNFGEQRSKCNPLTQLGHLAPLLGVTEEIGEYFEATAKGCEDGVKDAIADTIIYLLDFMSRLDLDIEDYETENVQDVTELIEELGRLNHHVLKMHQGIRGYEDTEFALNEIKETVYSLFDILHEICAIEGIGPPFVLATTTFFEIVSKRDWVTDPTTGNTHEPL